jgi:hypothetical protein
LLALAAAGAAPPFQFLVEGLPDGDPLLQQAVGELRAAARPLGRLRVVAHAPEHFQSSLDPARQAYTLRFANHEAHVQSSGIGLAYGLFRLAELIRSGQAASPFTLTERPAFPERMFSYQGILLDLPDEAYYSRRSPYVNLEALNTQLEAAREAIRNLAARRFNQVAFLCLNVEDLVNYDRLPGSPPVYPADSMHRCRTTVFQQALRELAAFAHHLHLEFWLQIYEFSFPDHLDGRRLNDDSDYVWQLVQAKFDELLSQVPIDGIVVTPTEPSPRLNYRGFQLWKTPEGAGRMAHHYHHVIVGRNRRRMIFRTWRVTNEMPAFERMLAEAPDPAIQFDAKYTNADFFLPVEPNHILTQGGPARRPFAATFDTFTQFDGWGRTLFYPRFWQPRFAALERAGVRSLNAWGPWLPGCIYPGTWAGRYDAYDSLRHGHSSSLATLDLFARLAWRPADDPAALARHWAQRCFGSPSPNLVQALLLSEDLWRTTYLDHAPHSQLAFKWTMLLVRRSDLVRRFAPQWPLALVQERNRQGLALARRIQRLVLLSPAGPSPSPALAEIRRAAEVTLLYFETFTRWRELLWRVDRATPVSTTDRTAAFALLAELEGLLPAWRRFPEESSNWLILQFDPGLITAPEWLQRKSLANHLHDIRQALAPA